MKKILKKVYGILPLKKQAFTLLKKFYTPSKNLYQHLHFVGNFKVKVNNEKSFKVKHYGYQVENEIFWNGLYKGWEKHSLMLWSRLCLESEVVFDIGANTGIYGLLAKTINSKASVYAFEPVERVFEKLMFNVKLNKYDIKCIKKAVSNYDGEATIYDTNSEHTYSVTVNKNTLAQSSKAIPFQIETIKLDTFIEQENISKIDLMKIDVETHEVEALQGFREYIRSFEPTILIEVLNDTVARGIEEIIAGIDYLFFNIDENLGVRQVDRFTKSDDYNFLICKQHIAAKLGLIQKA